MKTVNILSLLYLKHITSCPALGSEGERRLIIVIFTACWNSLNASHKPAGSGKPFFLPSKVNDNSTVMVNLILMYLVFNKSTFLLIM